MAQIVYGVEEHVAKRTNLRLDVARNGQINDQHRTVLAGLQRPLDQALTDDRQLTRRTGHHDVELSDHVGQGRKRQSLAGVPLGQLLCAPQSAIDEHHATRVAATEMSRTEFDHLSGTDEQDCLLLDGRIDALCDPDRGSRHGNRVRADVRARPDLLGHRERALEQLVQHGAEGAGHLGGAHGVLHLAENLGLTDDHRIETAGHPKGVTYSLLPWQRVDMRRQRVMPDAVVTSEPTQHLRRVLSCTKHLGTIAGGDDRRLFDVLAPHEIKQRRTQRISRKRHLLTKRQRGALVIDT